MAEITLTKRGSKEALINQARSLAETYEEATPNKALITMIRTLAFRLEGRGPDGKLLPSEPFVNP